MTSLNPYRTALDVLNTYGWIKGDLATPDGCVCAVGALCVVTGEQVFEAADFVWNIRRVNADNNKYAAETRENLQRTLGEIAAELFPERAYGPVGQLGRAVHFNDHADTTFEDVQLLFTTAADRWGRRAT